MAGIVLGVILFGDLNLGFDWNWDRTRWDRCLVYYVIVLVFEVLE